MVLYAYQFQMFKFLFTSPTSAQSIDTEKDLDEPVSRPSKKRRNNRAPTRGHVANLIGMRSVTPRSIAYVAVQVRISSSIVILLPNQMTLSFALLYPMQVHGMRKTGVLVMSYSTIILWISSS